MGINRNKVAPWYSDAVNIVKAQAADNIAVRVLEAGGGADRFAEIPGAVYTVVDISADHLAQNEYADIKLLGDIQTIDYGDTCYDVAVFWDVLEHVEDPLAAVDKVMSVLAPGGLIIAKGPILRSTKGLITTLTPWWFHVLYYRHVLGSDMAGKPGHAPFRTEHSTEAEGEQLKGHAESAGYEIIAFRKYVSDQIKMLRSKTYVGFLLYKTVGSAIRLVSRNKYGCRETDFLLVIKKAV